MDEIPLQVRLSKEKRAVPTINANDQLTFLKSFPGQAKSDSQYLLSNAFECGVNKKRPHMLGDRNIVAFAPTTDFERAKAFYVGILGLRFKEEDGFALVLDANGIMLRIAQVPAFVPARFTILGWEVKGIHDVMAKLTAKGVVFEQFGLPHQDATGLWTAPTGDKVAWFKDPDSNILSLSEHVKTS
jgi:catechol 2,3-dioxygenase-like lactoylglutathione lyase family enzyme